jgi:hypothetical protein
MTRKEYLNEFFSTAEKLFGMDISKNKKGIKFASEAIRKKMTVQEALDELEIEFCLIRIKVNE